jgi:uncharacterized protein YjeT (DUF2065 family)
MIEIYVIILGAVQVIIGLVELLAPARAYAFWIAWVSHRYFRFHGLGLIAIGLPLVIYTGRLSAAIFIIGIIMILTGPFLLIYPEKIGVVFNSVSEETGERGQLRLIYGEAILRIAVGALFITGPLL